MGGGTCPAIPLHSRSSNFNPPAPWGRDPVSASLLVTVTVFQSTRPVEGGTFPRSVFRPQWPISIHPPRGGAGHIGGNNAVFVSLFQSTRPVGGGTDIRVLYPLIFVISIHPPRGGRDSVGYTSVALKHAFQSTRPVGGGTCPNISHYRYQYISIHPPRGGRDSNHAQNLLCTFLQLAQSRDCAGLAAGHDGRRGAVRTGQHVDFSVRTLRYFSDRFRFAPSDHQNALGLITCLDAKVLHLGLIMVSEVVKPQAVLLRIHQRT